MTSKALEAARDELRLVLKYKTQSTSDAQLDLCVRDIIRAFAQNISEEAAIEQAEAAARHCKDNPDQRFVASWLIGIQAAIEKDLE